MSKYIISFDKSNEDIPTLVVAKESAPIYPFYPTIDIVKIITGDKAVRIFEELTKKEESEENEKDSSGKNVSTKSCANCKYYECRLNTEPCFSCFSSNERGAWELKEV